jgi:excisionase family DNA binding protein
MKRSKRQEVEMISEPLALRRREAAKVLGLSVTTVDRAIKRGDLIAKRYGTRVLVPRTEIARYLEALGKVHDKEKPPA